MGMRLRDYSQNTPKPLANIGYRPILWHVMSYYAHYGHIDFILCLGYQADAIKDYFLQYQEALSNDFVMSKGGREIKLLNRDIEDWTITFVDTGLHSNIGQRLKAVEQYVAGEDVFLANYADGLSDVPLDRYIDYFLARDKIGSFLSVRPGFAFHIVESEEDGLTRSIRSVQESEVRINGGYFIFRREIFDYIRDGEELVAEPFRRLIEKEQLLAYRYDGFWQCLDTFKDKQALEDLAARDDAPWQVWRHRDQP
jgi:glucose-1-phosphate cytidylyltransferase